MENTKRLRPELQKEIENFDIDGGLAAFSFARRLAQENGWTPDYTERAIREYKRFVYLATIADHMVSPSDEVDQVWHLHMLYTESYWKRLCGEVLPRPLSHGPTKGGREESVKFQDLYARTLGLYEQVFNETPPADIWPSPDDRNARKDHFQRVNLAENWVISKPKLYRSIRTVTAYAGIGGLAGCGAMASRNSGVTALVAFGIFLMLALVVLVIVAIKRGGSGGNGSGWGGGGCGGSSYVGMGCGSSDCGDSGGSSCSSGCGGGCGGGD